MLQCEEGIELLKRGTASHLKAAAQWESEGDGILKNAHSADRAQTAAKLAISESMLQALRDYAEATSSLAGTISRFMRIIDGDHNGR